MIQNLAIGNFRTTNLSELKMVVSYNQWGSLTVHSAAFRGISWIYSTEIWLWRLFPNLCLLILVAIKPPGASCLQVHHVFNVKKSCHVNHSV